MQFNPHLLTCLLLLSILDAGSTAAQDSAAPQASEPGLTQPERSHWAFHQPVPRQPPQVRDNSWLVTPADSFILARLEKAGLQTSPAADRSTLIRRVTFDLTGLPPPLKEVESCLRAYRPGDYPRVVQRLLASSHYGAGWAEPWLGVVHYAESNGYAVDAERARAWRYRDYVVRAFNGDMPFDQFLTEQLAGDLLVRGQE